MGNFTDKDKGWNKMITTFKANAGETSGFVGFLRSSGEYKKEEGDTSAPMTVAQVAALNEYGTQDIPERSFMRSALDENSKLLKRVVKKAVDSAIMGRTSKKQSIGLICEKMKALFFNKIQSGDFRPNAPSTIARKGSSHPLIDSTQMENSLDWEIKEGKS